MSQAYSESSRHIVFFSECQPVYCSTWQILEQIMVTSRIKSLQPSWAPHMPRLLLGSFHQCSDLLAGFMVAALWQGREERVQEGWARRRREGHVEVVAVPLNHGAGSKENTHEESYWASANLSFWESDFSDPGYIWICWSHADWCLSSKRVTNKSWHRHLHSISGLVGKGLQNEENVPTRVSCL